MEIRVINIITVLNIIMWNCTVNCLVKIFEKIMRTQLMPIYRNIFEFVGKLLIFCVLSVCVYIIFG